VGVGVDVGIGIDNTIINGFGDIKNRK